MGRLVPAWIGEEMPMCLNTEEQLTSHRGSDRLTQNLRFRREALMTTATQHPHIVQTDEILQGAPIITGTRTPVRAIAELWKFGVAPEEIVVRLPHITLAQVFDALSYYQEHRDAIDADIQRNRLSDDQIHPRLR